MIQDIAPHQLRNEYKPDCLPLPADTALIIREGKVLTAEGGSLPTVQLLPESEMTYLFSLDNQSWFLAPVPEALPEGMQFRDIRELRSAGSLPKHVVFGLMTGKHLSDWYRDTRFCGRCGNPTRQDAKERAMLCTTCGHRAYPRIMPAVIVGVKHGEKLLLTKYRRGIGYNALIAGFTEIGETAEETVAREVMEEAGVKVKNIRYYKSQPWGIANDLLLGYFCELDGDDETIRMDDDELKYAAFVSREDIELQPDDLSLTNEMMARFKSGQEQ